MSIRKEVDEAAFWDGYTCLSCTHTVPEDEDTDSGCPKCGADGLVSAALLTRFLDRLEADEGD